MLTAYSRFVIAALIILPLFPPQPAAAYTGRVLLRSGEELKGRIIVLNNDMYVFSSGALRKVENADVMDMTLYDISKCKPAPEKKDRYRSIIRKASEKYNVPEALITAVISVESDFDNSCVSDKGARGLMQLMPETSEGLKVKNVHNPEENILGGTRYLKYMLEIFKGDLDLALAAYNAGPNAVKKYGGIPPYSETVNYVKTVSRRTRKYRAEKKPVKKNIRQGKAVLTNE